MVDDQGAGALEVLSNAANGVASERALVGALLADADLVMPTCVEHGLTPPHFEDARHGEVFRTVQSIAAAGGHVDVNLVADDMRRRGVLDHIGGPFFLFDLIAEGGVPSLAGNYTAEVMRAAARREAQRIAAELQDALEDGSAPGGLLLEKARRLQELAEGSLGRQLQRFPTYSAEDIMAYESDPDHAIAGAGWLKRGGGTLLTGGTGFGKSVLVCQIGLSVAAGGPILGCMRVRRPFRVLHVQAENDAEVMRNTVAGILSHLEAGHGDLEDRWTLAHVYALDGPWLAAWAEPALRKHRPDLLIIDPYQSYLGAADINGSESFLRWRDFMEPLARQYGCALLVVCHTPKPTGDLGRWNPLASAYMAAGSSAIANWAPATAELTTVGQDTQRLRLRFGKNPAAAGLADEGGAMLHDLYIERAPDATRPFWQVAQDQGDPRRSEYRVQIIELATRHPQHDLPGDRREAGLQPRGGG